ncbi:MAG: hypothetical protein EZS28_001382 [Streblomastix strix]|uniref:Uncharacterized protein n=1 Tax=Streblomastix strix TaxID=222440 RepID=A0A5J4X9A2_9EUKA|nr:MAG: hypothetical protein EZS28_001382 [Streblomastix strix]
MQENDPRASAWEHMKDLRYAFFLMLEAAASNDEAKMAEYIQISLPQFLLPVLFACLHILRCMMRDFDQISGMQNQAWTQYFEMLDGMQIPQFSGAEFAVYMITPAFCIQKEQTLVSFRDALGSLIESGRQFRPSSAVPGWQQSADAQNMYMMLRPQALKPKLLEKEKDRYPYDDNGNEIDMDYQDNVQLGQLNLRQNGSLLVQSAEELPQFKWEPGEEDALRQIISLALPIRRLEDVVSAILRKRSLQVKAQDRSMSMLGQKIFNQIRLGIAILNCDQLEDDAELMILKGMEIYTETGRMREAALGSQSARVSTEQGRLRLQSIQDNIKNSVTQSNWSFGPWRNKGFQRSYYQQHTTPFNQWQFGSSGRGMIRQPAQRTENR